ncbi:MAG TPA: hypothetical protein VED59_08185, partial [Acidimicrobiales bacterium]|nr:hypothetical protein [Acidimicrobiales bacterium]
MLQRDATLRACTFGALESAVAKGGTVEFDCSSTIAFAEPITVKAGQVVTLDGAGRSVVLDGQSSTRLFVLSEAQGKTAGASLTLIDLTLQNAKFTGAAAWKATAGTAGSNGAAGTDGTAG